MRGASKIRVPSVWLATALYLLCASAEAQITIPAQTDVGEPIVASTSFEAKGYDWVSPTAKLVVFDGGKQVYVWAKPGQHRIELAAATADYKIHRFAAEFKVGDAPAPGPTPTPVTLRELVTTEQAAKVATYFRDFAGQIAKLKSIEQFWQVFADTFPVKDNAPLMSALKVRLDKAWEKTKGKEFSKELLAIAAELEVEQPVPSVPEPKPENVSATYVYEKDNTALRAQVTAGLNRLNREHKVRATAIDDDVLDGAGQVPEQYKVAISAAREAGLPSLIVTAGNKVLAVRKDPQTIEEILGAVP